MIGVKGIKRSCSKYWASYMCCLNPSDDLLYLINKNYNDLQSQHLYIFSSVDSMVLESQQDISILNMHFNIAPFHKNESVNFWKIMQLKTLDCYPLVYLHLKLAYWNYKSGESFSVMKTRKSHLCNRMRDERVSGCLVNYIV